ncbi:hypothetical protein Plhal304r1_c035g0109441 [Plasmopara halstedii]
MSIPKLLSVLERVAYSFIILFQICLNVLQRRCWLVLMRCVRLGSTLSTCDPVVAYVSYWGVVQ